MNIATVSLRVPDAAQHGAISAFTRVFGALWRSGALQTRDRFTLLRSRRSRISGAPHPGHKQQKMD